MSRRSEVNLRSAPSRLAGLGLVLSTLVVPLSASPNGTTKVLVGTGELSARQSVLAAGGTLVADRGSYQVFQIPDAVKPAVQSAGAIDRADFGVREHFDQRPDIEARPLGSSARNSRLFVGGRGRQLPFGLSH